MRNIWRNKIRLWRRRSPSRRFLFLILAIRKGLNHSEEARRRRHSAFRGAQFTNNTTVLSFLLVLSLSLVLLAHARVSRFSSLPHSLARVYAG